MVNPHLPTGAYGIEYKDRMELFIDGRKVVIPLPPKYEPTPIVVDTNCDHLWTRRREGSWCAHCGMPRWGVELSEEERQRLRGL